MDVPAKDLAVLFRSRHPLVACETVEETRFEALVREVAAGLAMPFWTWSAASGLTPSHPADAPKTTDLAFALKVIRASRGDGVWLLKDPQAHLENAAALRALRETAQEFAGSARTIVLVGPLLPRKAARSSSARLLRGDSSRCDPRNFSRRDLRLRPSSSKTSRSSAPQTSLACTS